MTTRTSAPSGPSTSGSAPPEFDQAVEVLRRHAENPSAFLALNADTERFTAAGIDGLVAYRRAGQRHLIQLGGVFADPADQDRLLARFLELAAAERRRVVSVQLQRADALRYARHGFAVNQLGSSYARSLADFRLGGKAHVSLRNKISRARRADVDVSEAGAGAAAPAGLDDQLAALDRQWLRGKGRHVKELAFMVGERTGPAAELRRLFVARVGDRVVGYITFSPAFGPHGGWLHDLSRRVPDAPPGTMELVIVTAVERFRAEGASHLHFGFTPFTGLGAEHDIVPGRSPTVARAVRLLAERGSAVYPAADQVAYKLKWAPDLVQPEYVAFHRGVRPAAVWQLLRLTQAL